MYQVANCTDHFHNHFSAEFQDRTDAGVTFVPHCAVDEAESERPRDCEDEESGFYEKVLSLFCKKDKKYRKQELKRQEQQEVIMAQFISQLRQEGCSEADINMHLCHIHDVPQPQFQQPLLSRSKGNSISGFFRSMHQALKDEFSIREKQSLPTVYATSVAPFYAAPPTEYIENFGFTYEDLVTLEPVCMGVKYLQHLPVSKFDGKPLPSEQTTCAICLGEFEKGEYLRSLQCFHFYHRECIDRWLGVGRNCPVCKTPVE